MRTCLRCVSSLLLSASVPSDSSLPSRRRAEKNFPSSSVIECKQSFPLSCRQARRAERRNSNSTNVGGWNGQTKDVHPGGLRRRLAGFLPFPASWRPGEDRGLFRGAALRGTRQQDSGRVAAVYGPRRPAVCSCNSRLQPVLHQSTDSATSWLRFHITEFHSRRIEFIVFCDLPGRVLHVYTYLDDIL